MECRKCHSKWEPSQNASKSLTACPFCGESLAEEEPFVPKDSRDVLTCIMRRYGIDVLLGDNLKSCFNDYAGGLGIPAACKNVIFHVSATGAGGILKKKATASAGEQEIAFRQAVQKIMDTYGTDRKMRGG